MCAILTRTYIRPCVVHPHRHTCAPISQQSHAARRLATRAHTRIHRSDSRAGTRTCVCTSNCCVSASAAIASAVAGSDRSTTPLSNCPQQNRGAMVRKAHAHVCRRVCAMQAYIATTCTHAQNARPHTCTSKHDRTREHRLTLARAHAPAHPHARRGVRKRALAHAYGCVHMSARTHAYIEGLCLSICCTSGGRHHRHLRRHVRVERLSLCV